MKFIDKYSDYVKKPSFAGMENCDFCDVFTHVNEWERSDGMVVFLCSRCEYQKRLPNA